MKAEAYEKLSQRAERMAQDHPTLYRALLVAIAAGGYLYILLILIVLLALLAAMVALMATSRRTHAGEIKIAIVLGGLAWILLRALWVVITPPSGVTLRREDGPRLFELIEDVRRTVQAPPARRVVLSHELNASVTQVPRLGLFGWHQNHLVIGLPLLSGLAPGQFRAVLAHEFGHLSGAHGKLGAWIYRIHQTWGRVAATFSERGSVMRFVFVPIFKWYVPRFAAFSLAQIRRHEYEADRCSGDAAGADAAASALMRIRVIAEVDREQWEALYRRANDEPEPPGPMVPIRQALAGFGDAARAEAWLRRALKEQTEGGDTHPALVDRVAALTGVPPASVADSAGSAASVLAAGPSAADVFLGENLSRLSDAVDQYWREQIAPLWRMRHEEVRKQRAALAEMDAAAARGEMKEAEQWGRVVLTEEVHGAAPALPLYQAFLERHPDDVRARFAVGRLLLEAKDPKGVALIDTAMEKAPDCRVAACQLLAQYYYEVGDLEASRQWRFKMEDAAESAQEIEQERLELKESDKLLPHELDAGTVELLRARLAAAEEEIRAYLVRKQTRLASEVTCHVLAVCRTVPWWRREDSAASMERERVVMEKVTADLALPFDLRIFIVRRSSLQKRLAKIQGAAIYPPCPAAAR